MKICPSCREEFLDHVLRCAACRMDLLGESAIDENFLDDAVLAKEELLKDEVISVMEAGLVQCREVERLLASAKIASLVYPSNLGSSSDVETLGATSDRKYMVLVRPLDLELAKSAMEGSFIEQVAKEGQGQYVSEAIDLASDTVICPACGEANRLKEGECPACGLFLAINFGGAT